ncbi:MAG TPA: hypothetical protein VG759_13225 [Candidatus Angelobacter sp.]|jgi:hypothetical protein|nr:hypothetical protein [Candidatus Angelobacter sp.]
MQLRYCRTILLACLTVLLIIIAGCGGANSSLGNSPSNPGTVAPPGGNPHSSTFIYVEGDRFGAPNNTFAFRFNSDGSTAAVPGSPFTNPQEVFTQAGKFLVGHDSSGFNVALYPVDANTGAPQPPVSVSTATARVMVADAVNVYSSLPGKGGNDAIDTLTIADGKLTPVPGSPFFIPGSPNNYFPLQLTSSLLFAGRFTDSIALGDPSKDDSDVTVFSRSSNGALARFAAIGFGRGVFSLVIHPSTRFLYKLDLGSGADCTLNVYSFDANSGASALVQQMLFPGCSAGKFVSGDKQGRYLFVTGNLPGVHVFSIDQNSGRISEVSGSPFFQTDGSISAVQSDPSGQFVVLLRNPNSFQIATLDAGTGKLTTVAAPVTIDAQNIGGITFAVF